MAVGDRSGARDPRTDRAAAAAMLVFTTHGYEIELPPGHPFPAGKYRAVADKLVTDGVLAAADLRDPGLATRAQMLRAHDAAWVDAVLTLTVDAEMTRRIGLPVDAAVARRSRASAAGTIAAARAALTQGVACNLAGGTHHAGRARGAGFCLVNDLAIAALDVLAEGLARRVAIVDLDVHQGDGSNEILAERRDVLTLDLYGMRNFPRVKVPAVVDVPLPDGVGDDEYLTVLDRHLDRMLDGFAPDLVLYQAGVDPLCGDRFGRLALSPEGLRARDRRVLTACRSRRIAVATVMGGGYGRDLTRTVAAHAATVEEAALAGSAAATASADLATGRAAKIP